MGIKVKAISFLAANVAFILLVLGTATDHWAGRENDRLHVYESLFTKCVHHKHSGRVICMKPYRHSIHAKLVMTILLIIMTIILHIIAVILYLYLICIQEEHNGRLEKGLAFILLGALMTLMAGIIIYTTYYDSYYYTLKWSYAVCWGSVIAYFTSLIFQIIYIDKAGEEGFRRKAARSISLPLNGRRTSTLNDVLAYFRRRSVQV